MKIIVTGASGFLGREVVLSALRRGFNVIAIHNKTMPILPISVSKKTFDLCDLSTFQQFVLQEFPDAIINCAAIASIEKVKENPEYAEKINVALPRQCAMLANHLSCRFIHVSTDMVFDGDKGNYEHTDKPLPRNLYAQTKLLAEKEVLAYGKSNACVIRTSLLSGNSTHGNKSLHERLLHTWANGEKTHLFSDEIRQPVSVENLADVLIELCERPTLSGVYHWAGKESLSRYDIGMRIAKHFKLPTKNLISKTNYNESEEAKMTRPKDLSMILYPLSAKLKTQAKSFDEMLEELSIPNDLSDWYHSITGEKIVRKLIKGIDF